MASCECCWSRKALYGSYKAAMRAHLSMGCICSQNTLAGLEAAAGQFWIDGRDSRYSESEWAEILKALDAGKE